MRLRTVTSTRNLEKLSGEKVTRSIIASLSGTCSPPRILPRATIHSRKWVPRSSPNLRRVSSPASFQSPTEHANFLGSPVIMGPMMRELPVTGKSWFHGLATCVGPAVFG